MSEGAVGAKMRAAGATEAEIGDFLRAYRSVAGGRTNLISESSIEPLEKGDGSICVLPAAEPPAHCPALAHTAVLRLNGGIGTTMGLDGPKSLLEAHGGHTFLDIIMCQIKALRRACGATLPLIFLNSPATDTQTARALGEDNHPTDGIPPSILQVLVPRLDPATLDPISWPADPSQEWAPPGHGDLYGVLARTGIIDRLLERGYRYLFVANADNLGAVPDASIATWFAAGGADFVAEVVRRSPMDVKGGHYARRRKDGKIVLRETAQTPPEDLPYFQDLNCHPYVNTNNLWLNLASLRSLLQVGGLDLPVIVNHKMVGHPGHAIPAIQLESAMGSAIGSFAHSQLIAVDHSRFIPVKKMADLMLLRSDAFELTNTGILEDRASTRPVVDLDDRYFSRFEDFSARVEGIPSLVHARSLTVTGDARIPAGYVAEGDALITGPEPELS